MLKKVISIRNIGKFKACAARGDVEFRSLTLIYAANGRGKTTFCDILHSLQTGRPENILGRKSVGAIEEPAVELRFDEGSALFQGGTWNTTKPDLLIYDTSFIHANVYTGDSVAHDHKKNLYRVAVGVRGVELARNVETLDADIRTANRTIDTRKEIVTRLKPQTLSLEAFMALPPEPNIDATIAEASRTLAASRRADELLHKPLLASIVCPQFPSSFRIVLARTIADLSRSAEEAIRDHMKNHLVQPDEDWIARGLALTVDAECPFCGQALQSSAIFAAYRTFFAQEYRDLKTTIDDLKDEVERFGSDSDFLRLRNVQLENEQKAGYWRQFVDLVQPSLDLSHAREILVALRDVAMGSMERKTRAPLDAIVVGTDFEARYAALEALQLECDTYNLAIEQANGLITAQKNAMATADVPGAEGRLRHLTAVQLRHSDASVTACENLQAAVAAKTELENRKRLAKGVLDEHTAEVFGRYQNQINRLLRLFGATFRIAGTRCQYPGGTPSCTYNLLIDNEEIDPGGPETPPDRPSFRNTLSSGDRNTLALAFFLSQLSDDPSLGQKIVVFDDPFTSLDRSRRTFTQQEICRLARNAGQVIVFSHDPHFLANIEGSMDASAVKVLQFAGVLQDTTIGEYSLDETLQTSYMRSVTQLRRFLEGSDSEEPYAVAHQIRPLLEDCLRIKLPRTFAAHDSLGQMIRKIREADSAGPLGVFTDLLPDLEDVNGYATPFGHGGIERSRHDPIDLAELGTYITRALEIASGS